MIYFRKSFVMRSVTFFYESTYFIINTKYGVFMNCLDKPLNHDNESSIPPYPFSGYDNTEELDKDVEYMKRLYSRALRMIQQEVDEECDKLEYGGSCMFDTFPDQVHLGTIIDAIYDRIKDMDWDLQAEQISSTDYLQPAACRGNNCPPASPSPCRGNNCPPSPPPMPCRGNNCPPSPPPIPCRGNNCPPPPPPMPCRGSNCPPPPRPSRPPQPPRPDYRPDGKPDWQRDLIASLLYNEMIHRRRRYRSRNQWNQR